MTYKIAILNIAEKAEKEIYKLVFALQKARSIEANFELLHKH